MKDKLINFLLIFILIFLVLNFFENKKTQNQTSNTIILKNDNSFSIPSNIKFEIINQTENDFNFNPCKDLVIKKDSKNIIIDECEEINIKPNENYIIDYSKYYDNFKEIWKYYVSLKKGDLDIISQFEIKNPWIFKKFFVFFFYAPIYNLMAFLLEITSYSLWWAIIIITIIIRLVLLIPQHKMMINQKKMQAIQPKIKVIQDKHKWNHQMLWIELMKLYKDEKVNPAWSCWLLLIQMPILIVIYRIIIGIKDPSNTYYLYNFLWDYNMLSINGNFFGLDLFWVWWLKWLILAIIIWLLQYTQVKLSLSYNKKEGKNIVLEKKKNSNDYSSFMPDPDMLNKFMLYWMPIMIAIIAYTFFAWIGIYWWIWTLFMIFQQLIVNKILQK